MIVMKFGGTSVANAEAINRAIGIVKGKLDQRPVVVVSALSGVTDMLYKITAAAAKSDVTTANTLIDSLKQRHITLVDELLADTPQHEQATHHVEDICENLRTFVNAVCSVGELTERSHAKIISNGEWLSSTVIWFAMNAQGISTGFVDARTMIITSGSNMKGEPMIQEIENRVPQQISAAYEGNQCVITQGFITSTTDGEAAVLGRGGSDYSASLIGMAINATAIEIWTDVDGVKTADPRRVVNTARLERISFEEAAEMAHFGAKVLHPLTIEPAVMKDIPVYVLNSLNPTCTGTAILQSEQIPDGVKSLSFKEDILMINIFSPKMINVPGFLSRVFEIFARNNVSVDLISTSEANISVTVDGNQDLSRVVDELSHFAEVHIHDDKAQLSIIGKNVVKQRGLIRWSLVALKNTNIYMISQDASFVNISFVVDREALNEVLQELHQYLFEY